MGNPIPPGSVTDIALGKSLYEVRCVQCHGADGLGNPSAKGLPHPPPPIDAGGLGARSDQQVFDVIANGLIDHGMPPFRPSMTDLQIWQTVTYLRQL